MDTPPRNAVSTGMAARSRKRARHGRSTRRDRESLHTYGRTRRQQPGPGARNRGHDVAICDRGGRRRCQRVRDRPGERRGGRGQDKVGELSMSAFMREGSPEVLHVFSSPVRGVGRFSPAGQGPSRGFSRFLQTCSWDAFVPRATSPTGSRPQRFCFSTAWTTPEWPGSLTPEVRWNGETLHNVNTYSDAGRDTGACATACKTAGQKMVASQSFFRRAFSPPGRRSHVVLTLRLLDPTVSPDAGQVAVILLAEVALPAARRPGRDLAFTVSGSAMCGAAAHGSAQRGRLAHGATTGRRR